MSVHVDGLDNTCPVCERAVGDHSVREWFACAGEPTLNLAYEPTAPEYAELVARLGVPSDVLIADTVIVRAVTLDASGALDVRTMVPGLIHEFAAGVPGRAPLPVAKVLLLGGADVLKAYGRLVRDSATGAVNAASGES